MFLLITPAALSWISCSDLTPSCMTLSFMAAFWGKLSFSFLDLFDTRVPRVRVELPTTALLAASLTRIRMICFCSKLKGTVTVVLNLVRPPAVGWGSVLPTGFSEPGL